MYDFSLLCDLARVTLCGIGDLGSRRGGSTCPTASSSVSKGTAPEPVINTRGNAGLWWGGMMMIAFITIKSSLVPLIEGLCAQI